MMCAGSSEVSDCVWMNQNDCIANVASKTKGIAVRGCRLRRRASRDVDVEAVVTSSLHHIGGRAGDSTAAQAEAQELPLPFPTLSKASCSANCEAAPCAAPTNSGLIIAPEVSASRHLQIAPGQYASSSSSTTCATRTF